jgi:acetoin utilization deacetylase AcuC-like enzyme
MKTGVFFHDEFKNKDWPIIGDKFRNFPAVMEKQLSLPGVVYIETEAAPDDVLLLTHTPQYIAEVKRSWYYRGASLAVGGCVRAGEMIATGVLTNALTFSVGAGHHSGRAAGWGGTYLSCSGPTIANIRRTTGLRRFAIIDTDCHHGDGTRSIFEDDREVLHVCFCSYSNVTGEGTNVDVDVWDRINDDDYLSLVDSEFIARIRTFKPEMVIHNLGHDTAQGDYGDLGLTRDFFPILAEKVKRAAGEVCGGRYMIITHGGARADVAEYIFPRIVEILAGNE